MEKDVADALDQELLFALRELERTSHSNEAQKLFEIHNRGGWPRETGYTCGAYIQRVLGRVRAHLQEKGLL